MTKAEHDYRSGRMLEEAINAGLPVRGPLRSDLQWRPGIVVTRSVTNRAVRAFAELHGYTLCPSGREAIIEEPRK
jgi:hypothetical protein